MGGRAEKSEKQYVYAIINGHLPQTDDLNTGIEEAKVCAISANDLTALVSNISLSKIRPERRHISAHQGVLKQLMETHTVLPMAFGMIAKDPEAVKTLLKQNNDVLCEQLERLAGKDEMGLRVRWSVPNIFEYFILTHPELKRARDQLFGTHREPTMEEKIEIGRLFERMRDQDRETHRQKIEEILTPHCAEFKFEQPRSEQEILNMACLIKRENRKEFETAVFESAGFFDDNFTFDYSGPWVPHSFVDINLEL